MILIITQPSGAPRQDGPGLPNQLV